MNLNRMTKAALKAEVLKLQGKEEIYKLETSAYVEALNQEKDKNQKLNDLVNSIDNELPDNKFWWIQAISIVKAIIKLIQEFKKK